MPNLNSEFFRNVLNNPKSSEVQEIADHFYEFFVEKEQTYPHAPNEEQIIAANRVFDMMFEVLAGRISVKDTDDVLDYANYRIEQANRTERFKRRLHHLDVDDVGIE